MFGFEWAPDPRNVLIYVAQFALLAGVIYLWMISHTTGIKTYNKEHKKRIEIRQCKYLYNIVEQVVRQSDHRNIERTTRPMLNFKNFERSQATLKGIELIAMLKKCQQRYSVQSV